jgi:hypothetical protein
MYACKDLQRSRCGKLKGPDELGTGGGAAVLTTLIGTDRLSTTSAAITQNPLTCPLRTWADLKTRAQC